MKIDLQVQVLRLYILVSILQMDLVCLPAMDAGWTRIAVCIFFHITWGLGVYSMYWCYITPPGEPQPGWPADVPPPTDEMFASQLQTKPLAPRINEDYRVAVKDQKPLPVSPKNMELCDYVELVWFGSLREHITARNAESPWTGNCIGFYNYKYYVMLLFWGILNIVTTAIVSLSLLERHSMGWFFYFVFLFSLGMTVAVGALFCIHVFVMSRGITTIEFLERKRQTVDLAMWDQGDLVKNYSDALGPPALWLIPTREGIKGDGLGWSMEVY